MNALLSFANAHDWGQNAVLTADGGVTVEEHATLNGEPLPVNLVTFYSLREMRDWAGY